MFRRFLQVLLIEKSTTAPNIQAPHPILLTRNLRVEIKIKTDIVSIIEKDLEELISAFNAAETKTLKKL
jgi:DNA-directed RNA polymerase subunit L